MVDRAPDRLELKLELCLAVMNVGSGGVQNRSAAQSIPPRLKKPINDLTNAFVAIRLAQKGTPPQGF
jgi:hypothetical protein